MRACDDEGSELSGVVGETEALGEACAQKLKVMPLGCGGCDKCKAVLVVANAAHFGEDASASVSEIHQIHAADFRQGASDLATQELCCACAREIEAGEAREIKDANMIAHCFTFFADALLPWARAGPCVRCFFGGIVTVLSEPIGALPAVVVAHLSAEGFDACVDGRQLAVGGGGPAMPWEVHGVFVAVDFHAFRHAVVVICVVGVAARIDGPHIPFCCTIDDPFGHDLASTAALGDAEGKDTGLEGIINTRHRADQWEAIGGIRDRAVDDA